VRPPYDLICPPVNAYELHRAWPSSQLWFVGNGGHALSDKAIAQALKHAMDSLKQEKQECL